MRHQLSNTSPAKSLIRELRKIRPVQDCGNDILSWELSSRCRFWILLTVHSNTKSPVVGVALPDVMERVTVLLSRAGMRQAEKVDWCCAPVFSFPVEMILETPALKVFSELSDNYPIDSPTLATMIETILSAERKLLAVAGTIEAATDWSRAKIPFHPTQCYSIPVGYCVIGREADARSYIENRVEKFRLMNELESLSLYQKFVCELKADFENL